MSIRAISQFTNQYWKVGRKAGVDFSSGSSVINVLDTCKSSLNFTNTSICDRNGKIIFYSNACRVYNRFDQIMPNGSGFNQGIISSTYVNTDYYFPFKAATIIPFPNDTNKFYMFYLNMEWNISGEYLPEKLYYLVVDRTLNGGLGDVTLKDQVVISNDTLGNGELLAIQHGNGNDWWIICRKFRRNIYYKILIDTNGVHTPIAQSIGSDYNFPDVFNGVCNSSMDGTKIGFCEGITLPNVGQIDLFDFDRCTSVLSNYKLISYANNTDTFYWTALCFSPNNRFLYVHDFSNVWQLDLNSSNIFSSAIKLPNFRNMGVSSIQLTPDNKIFLGPYGSDTFIAVINYPDSLGFACNFNTRALNFNFGGQVHWVDGGLPNNPNFALGKLNCPAGINEIGSENVGISIYPNPVNESLVVSSKLLVKKVEVMDLLGQKFENLKMSRFENEIQINVSGLISQIYILRITDEKGNVLTKKFVKE